MRRLSSNYSKCSLFIFFELSARLLSFWMTWGHFTTCSHCIWYWPYSFICGHGIILFIEAWNWTALPDLIPCSWNGLLAHLVTNLTTPALRIIAFKELDILLPFYSPPYHTQTLSLTHYLSLAPSLQGSVSLNHFSQHTFCILFTVSLAQSHNCLFLHFTCYSWIPLLAFRHSDKHFHLFLFQSHLYFLLTF